MNPFYDCFLIVIYIKKLEYHGVTIFDFTILMIEISDGYLNCNDPHCTNVLHRTFMEVYCHSIIESGIKASSVSIPLVRPNVQMMR